MMSAGAFAAVGAGENPVQNAGFEEALAALGRNRQRMPLCICAGAVLFLEARDASGKVLASVNSAAVVDSGGVWQLAQASVNAPQETKSITVKIVGLYCIGAFYVNGAALVFVR